MAAVDLVIQGLARKGTKNQPDEDPGSLEHPAMELITSMNLFTIMLSLVSTYFVLFKQFCSQPQKLKNTAHSLCFFNLPVQNFEDDNGIFKNLNLLKCLNEAMDILQNCIHNKYSKSHLFEKTFVFKQTLKGIHSFASTFNPRRPTR